MHYNGKLKDGTEFDSSAGRGKLTLSYRTHVDEGIKRVFCFLGSADGHALVPPAPTLPYLGADWHDTVHGRRGCKCL